MIKIIANTKSKLAPFISKNEVGDKSSEEEEEKKQQEPFKMPDLSN
jgi:hypothetical protein